MLSTVYGKVRRIKKISNRDNRKLKGFKHGGVQDVLEAFVIEGNGETTVSKEGIARAAPSNIFFIDQHFAFVALWGIGVYSPFGSRC